MLQKGSAEFLSFAGSSGCTGVRDSCSQSIVFSPFENAARPHAMLLGRQILPRYSASDYQGEAGNIADIRRQRGCVGGKDGGASASAGIDHIKCPVNFQHTLFRRGCRSTITVGACRNTRRSSGVIRVPESRRRGIDRSWRFTDSMTLFGEYGVKKVTAPGV